ncbi:MAG: hypothetical protein LJE70_06930 [Chromatiaceae bacterium]|jgi:uncharacterized protein GlcG (DUF336 family)|nr:hypothetical protein [Chromatiaceae bacterium]
MEGKFAILAQGYAWVEEVRVFCSYLRQNCAKQIRVQTSNGKALKAARLPAPSKRLPKITTPGAQVIDQEFLPK